MGLFEAVVLGIVQAITEFLPISSDGHLILIPSVLGWKRFGLGFDVILHFGTLIATIAYFRADVARLAIALVTRDEERAHARRLSWLLIASTVPSVIVVLALESFVNGVENRSVAQQLAITGWGLLATTALLVSSELLALRARKRGKDAYTSSERLPWALAIGIGFAQGFAALPGLSRSGTTIATGQALGMERGEAARFSFLLSIPIIGAATAKKLLDLASGEGAFPPVPVMLVGVTVTALVGYGVIWLLLPFVRKHSLGWFAAYTGITGMLLVVTQSGSL